MTLRPVKQQANPAGRGLIKTAVVMLVHMPGRAHRRHSLPHRFSRTINFLHMFSRRLFMTRVLRIVPILLVSLFALILQPGNAAAAATCTETVTVQVNFTMPDGHSVIGTVVAHRTIGDTTQTTLNFTGMINGSPATATAEGTELWTSDSQATLAITKFTSWNASVGQPDPLTVNVVQTAPGLLTVNGLPVAMNGLLHAPACGTSAYTFTNPGQGPTQVAVLPNTGAGPFLADPALVAVLLMLAGFMLVLASRVLGKRARRAVPVHAGVE
jgi:hypothetical protein